MTPADSKREWRRYKDSQEEQRSLEFDVRVAIAGTITVEPVEPYLGAHLLRKNLKPNISVGPFNQLRQICYDHRAVLGRGDLNTIVFLLRIEDLFPEMLAGCLEGTASVSD